MMLEIIDELNNFIPYVTFTYSYTNQQFLNIEIINPSKYYENYIS